jgi:hypothetical protein
MNGDAAADEDDEEADGRDSSDEDLEDQEESADVKDPRAGRVDVTIPQLMVDYDQLAADLFEAGSDSSVKGAQRRILYRLTKQFKALVEGRYPLSAELSDEETFEEPPVIKTKRERKRKLKEDLRMAETVRNEKKRYQEELRKARKKPRLDEEAANDSVTADEEDASVNGEAEEDSGTQTLTNGTEVSDTDANAAKRKKKKAKRKKKKTSMDLGEMTNGHDNEKKEERDEEEAVGEVPSSNGFAKLNNKKKSPSKKKNGSNVFDVAEWDAGEAEASDNDKGDETLSAVENVVSAKKGTPKKKKRKESLAGGQGDQEGAKTSPKTPKRREHMIEVTPKRSNDSEDASTPLTKKSSKLKGKRATPKERKEGELPQVGLPGFQAPKIKNVVGQVPQPVFVRKAASKSGE